MAAGTVNEQFPTATPRMFVLVVVIAGPERVAIVLVPREAREVLAKVKTPSNSVFLEETKAPSEAATLVPPDVGFEIRQF